MSKVIEPVTAESAPAPTTAETAEPSVEQRIGKLSGEERREYDLTGKLPKIEKPVPTTEKVEAAKDAPASGPDDHREPPKRSRYLDREVGRLSIENRRLQRENEALKAPKSNAEVSTTAAPSKAADGKPVPPDPETYKGTNAEYNRDYSKYVEDLADWKADQRDAQRRADEESVHATAEVTESVEKFKSAEKPYAESSPTYWKAKDAISKALDAVFKDVPVGQRYIDRFLIRSSVGPAIVDHLYKNPSEFQEVLEMSPEDAIARLGELSATVKRAPKPKTVTSVNDPPTQLSGRAEVVDGPKPGSQAWMDAENAKDIARFKSRGR